MTFSRQLSKVQVCRIRWGIKGLSIGPRAKSSMDTLAQKWYGNESEVWGLFIIAAVDGQTLSLICP